MNLGRTMRTVSALHPLQIATRAPHVLVGKLLRDVPTTLAPSIRSSWPPPPRPLVEIVASERVRSSKRLANLPSRSRLYEYESCYGLEVTGEPGEHRDWTSHAAVEPYPASVRARQLAVATRLGRVDLGPELARAARAVAIQPELHLLGNHLLENGFALACAGCAGSGLEAEIWWRLGAGLLDWQLPLQFLPDGGHVERCASYHVALTAALLETLELCNAAGRVAPEGWRRIAQKALGWMEAVRAPDGTFALFNDSTLDAAPEIEQVLSLARSLGVVPRPSDLRDTGWIRLDVGDACMIVDAGPDADGWQPAHAHADGLTFELWVHGERAVVDFGVAAYDASDAREATRATRSHNTVEVGGIDSCEVWGAFRVGRRGHGRLTRLDRRVDRASLDVDHDGYLWLPGGPRHRRSFVLTPSSLEVVDRLTTSSYPAASRIRLSEPERVRVLADAPITRSSSSWYACLGVGRPASLLEQSLDGGDTPGAAWRLEW
jgi:hypothetical protein